MFLTENSEYNFVYKYKSIYKKEVKNMKKVIALLLAIIMCFAFCACEDNSGGDGITTCKNCGRKKRLSYAGFCSTCQEGFEEWQDRYYEND